MAIESITIEEIAIPFKQSFSHASATRKVTEAVVVRARSNDGHIGYGEGCPRSYVTGETVASARRFFEHYQGGFAKIACLDQLKSWVISNSKAIDDNPAAWCAIELAILDMLAQEGHQTVERLLSRPSLAGEFYYTAVLGSEGLEAFAKQLEQYQQSGFQAYKVKVSGKLGQDREKVALFKNLKGTIDIRLDANNLWVRPEQAIAYIASLEYPFSAIEEPLSSGNYSGCKEIHKALGIPIILDESFLRQQQFDHLKDNLEPWVINLRLSKMGGILRSLGVAEKAEKLGIPIVIGAQVGETSILTRAALTVASAYSNIVIAQEGAFGTHLLERDVVDQPIMFGAAGKLNIRQGPNCDGFGLECTL